jgi:NADH-quinone oxidoreductase subunit M
MILSAILFWPLAGGLLAWLSQRWGEGWPRRVAAASLSLHLAAVAALWIWSPGGTPALEVRVPWIPELGIDYHLALDGLSLLLILLTSFLGLMAVLASWSDTPLRPGFFHLNLLWILTALVGAFLALDLALFYLFWEMMLVPLYFLIGIWGYERRMYATVKFFLFTQAASLLLLVAILALYFYHGEQTGTYTFNYRELLGTALPPGAAPLLMLGFFAAFAVKLPTVPLHTWLPDAHTEAPTAGSVVLAGLVLKVGAYGFIRFLVPLFPQAARDVAPVAMALGVAGILYGGLVASGQRDLKRLVAYTSVSHMGFVLLGVFAWNELALQGAVIVLLAHGLSTGALFILVGDLYRRTHTRNLAALGGLWSTVPRMGGAGMFFALASLGLPGLGNFVGEFLVLVGTYRVSPLLAALAAIGFVISTIYSLRLVQRTFFGPNERGWQLPDLGRRELVIFAALIVLLLWLGLYPQPFLDTAAPALEALREQAGPAADMLPGAGEPLLAPPPSGADGGWAVPGGASLAVEENRP